VARVLGQHASGAPSLPLGSASAEACQKDGFPAWQLPVWRRQVAKTSWLAPTEQCFKEREGPTRGRFQLTLPLPKPFLLSSSAQQQALLFSEPSST